jgi:REP element-mobilizing transposase RayT
MGSPGSSRRGDGGLVRTRSKFISSVGAVTLDVVQGYIASQKGV